MSTPVALSTPITPLYPNFNEQILCTNPENKKLVDLLVEEMVLKGEEDGEVLEKLYQVTQGG